MKKFSLTEKGILIIFLNVFCIITITAQNAFEGYTLYNTTSSHTTYLIDMEESIAHSWQSSYSVANTVYLLENGSILRTGHDPSAQFNGGAVGGIIQEINWEGDVVWQYTYSNYDHCQHHDIKQLPNGNVIMIAWERKSSSEVVQAGGSSSQEKWPLHIVEVQPTGSTSGDIVWEWHIWDHIVQDHDPTKDNYGVIADHPELLDINCNGDYIDPPGGDWIHANGIDYNPELDQIVFSSHVLDEFYVIDHSTTTEEAASHSGGNAGMGGDILFRWGNPQNYDRGNYSDRKFYVLHNAHWIDEGLEGEGNIMVFNNGQGRPGGSYSSVDVVEPPIINTYNYSIESGMAFGPEELSWTYATPVYSNHLSGAQRLPNGNTLVVMGTSGYFVEINEDEDIVWSYASGGQCTRAYRYSPYYPGVSNLLPVAQQQINISGGFNFVSTRIEFEYPDMLTVLQDILGDNLVYVRGSGGEMLRKIGPNWVNGIGDWITLEGYLFKMTGPETLVFDGAEIDPSTPIILNEGFQFVSYLPSYSEDALIAFNNILNDNLEYIRNSVGGMLRKIGPNWVNGLGDANPGEGYLIKMSGNDELIYPQSEKKSDGKK
ncbi:MAG: aryl-sulfate sulfotransferase [Bacteroidales bacterium]|nr:aryl-sulfate sulfotransferase [Bacteroidales bacterium]